MSDGKDIDVLVIENEANSSRAEALISGLTHEQFNWHPEAGRWSIAQNLAHLNTVHGKDLESLRPAINAARSASVTGSGPFRYGLLSRKFVASMEPPVTRKFKAPKAFEPPFEAALESSLAEYRRTSAELRQLLILSRGMDLARVKTRLTALPALLQPILKMPLGARFELINAHDRRHLWQAEQIRKSL
jgi:hypothetical protein